MQLWGVPWWVGVAVALLCPAAPRDAAPGAAAGSPQAPSALVVLHRWDSARSAAWAAGDVPALRRLYTPGSPAGRADVRLLRRYLARGLRVQGLATQVFSARTVVARPRWVRLVLVDRLAGGVARGHGIRVPLPRDRADQRTVTLRRVAGRWLVADVR